MRKHAVKAWRWVLGTTVFQHRRNVPISEATFARATVIMYFLMMLWGVTAAIGEAPAVLKITNETFSFYWTALVAIGSGIAGCAATFPHLYKLEMYVLSSLIFIIGLYPASVIVLAIFSLDDTHISSIFVGSFIVVMPITRLVILIRSARNE